MRMKPIEVGIHCRNKRVDLLRPFLRELARFEAVPAGSGAVGVRVCQPLSSSRRPRGARGAVTTSACRSWCLRSPGAGLAGRSEARGNAGGAGHLAQRRRAKLRGRLRTRPDIGGTFFLFGGEPFTDAKAEVIHRAGCQGLIITAWWRWATSGWPAASRPSSTTCTWSYRGMEDPAPSPSNVPVGDRMSCRPGMPAPTFDQLAGRTPSWRSRSDGEGNTGPGASTLSTMESEPADDDDLEPLA
jgi:hypothetical protein